jgi:general L-amino acid transport system permease protein
MTANLNQPGDAYVTQADLAERRLAPRPPLLIALVSSPVVKRLVGALYILAVAALWEPFMALLGKPAALTTGEWLSPAAESLVLALVLCLPLIVVTLLAAFRNQARTGSPFYRDVDFLRNSFEILLLLGIILAGATLLTNLQTNLAASGLVIDFNVIRRLLGVELTEGPDPGAPLNLAGIPLIGQSLAEMAVFQPDTVFRALAVGFVNTLRVSALALAATTLLGMAVGVGLLARNWLVRNVASAFTEVFRNTPLLVQLFFIYNGVIKLLPARPREAVTLVPDAVYVSGRGFYYPALLENPSASSFWMVLIIGVVVAALLWRWRIHVYEQTGQPARALIISAGALAAFVVGGLLAAAASGGFPFSLEYPTVGSFNFSGGSSFSAEYVALFLGLTLYTAAFIADIVRAGIQSVHKGQIEAARALGLNAGQTLNRVVLPQALRLAVPLLTNQYLNLVKNSSLGIAIGFLDLYNVGTIAYNQTGQAVAIFTVMAVVYLATSLIISFVMNLVNSTLRIRTR